MEMLSSAVQASDIKLTYRRYGFSFFRATGFSNEVFEAIKKLATNGTQQIIRNTWMKNAGTRKILDTRTQVLIPRDLDKLGVGPIQISSSFIGAIY